MPFLLIQTGKIDPKFCEKGRKLVKIQEKAKAYIINCLPTNIVLDQSRQK